MSNKLTKEIIDRLIEQSLNEQFHVNNDVETYENTKETKNKSKKDLDKLIEEVILETLRKK